MKKKLVEFIGRIQDGGAETLVKDYALLLDKDKFDITILCEDYRPESNTYKIEIYNLSDSSVINYKTNDYFDELTTNVFSLIPDPLNTDTQFKIL